MTQRTLLSLIYTCSPIEAKPVILIANLTSAKRPHMIKTIFIVSKDKFSQPKLLAQYPSHVRYSPRVQVVKAQIPLIRLVRVVKQLFPLVRLVQVVK